MVGDGLNDAPALAAAHASSVAGYGHAHMSQAVADAVFPGRASRAGAGGGQGVSQGAAGLMRQNLWLAVRLQRAGCADRDRRPGHSADRRGGDVGFVGYRHAQCAEGASEEAF